ncbi:MAG: radical SAM protein, partial [Mogibacterium sp.]|nr:radical SAM protein [Mogibacterium sp.]
MRDCYNRKIDYMRISVTNRCNFRCTYCMPETKKVEETLSLDEIYEVAFAASECGITKYKITGGEPLIREGIVDFIKKLHTLDNIKDITMTTNGFYLE